MKPQKHSKVFSPSKSALWLNCYLSAIFTDGNGNEANEQAEFGTECHELVSPYVVYQEGAISLVSISDPREEIKGEKQEEKSSAEN